MDNLFVRKLRDGDKESWSLLFQSNVDILYKYGICIVQDDEVIKDLIQDVFLSLYENKGRISRIENMQRYLLSALKYKILDYIKAQRIRKNAAHNYLSELIPDFLCPLEVSENMVLEELLIEKMLGSLTERQQEFIILRFYKGLSHETISCLCGLKKQTVSNAIHKALKTLNKRFKGLKS